MVRVKHLPVLVVVFWAAASAASAERAYPRASTDFDAEFARAADLLEEGKREEAERVLETLLRNADQPAWNARAAMLLGVGRCRAGGLGGRGARARSRQRRADRPRGLPESSAGRGARAFGPPGRSDRARPAGLRGGGPLRVPDSRRDAPRAPLRAAGKTRGSRARPRSRRRGRGDSRRERRSRHRPDPPRRRPGRYARDAVGGARSSAARADPRRPFFDPGLRAARGGRGREDALAGRPRPPGARARRRRRPPAWGGPPLQGSQRGLAGRGARSEPARSGARAARIEEDEGGGGNGLARSR